VVGCCLCPLESGGRHAFAAHPRPTDTPTHGRVARISATSADAVQFLQPERATAFATFVGNAAYGNHPKLSLSPWRLEEDGAAPRSRKLPERGVRFMHGQFKIPRKIEAGPSRASGKQCPRHCMILVRNRAIAVCCQNGSR
jgi:hypothetical protein